MALKPIIFLHLQKTGGSSLRAVFKNIFGNTGNVRGFNGRKPDGTWCELTDEQKNAKVWHSHMPFGMHQLLPVPVPYMTVVRDPVQREISRYRSNHRVYRKQGNCPVETHRPDWGMVYQLSGLTRHELRDLSEAHIDVALQNLRDHFLHVGDTSRLEETGQWLRDELGWPVSLPLPRVNAAKPDTYVTDEETERLRRLPGVKLDTKFYKLICKLGPDPQRWVV